MSGKETRDQRPDNINQGVGQWETSLNSDRFSAFPSRGRGTAAAVDEVRWKRTLDIASRVSEAIANSSLLTPNSSLPFKRRIGCPETADWLYKDVRREFLVFPAAFTWQAK